MKPVFLVPEWLKIALLLSAFILFVCLMATTALLLVA